MVEEYNVARMHYGIGVEVIQIYPYLSWDDAEEIRASMQWAFPDNEYVLLNMKTYLNPEKTK